MSANKFIQNNKKLSAQYQKAVELSEKYNHAEYYAYTGSLRNKQISEYAPYFDKLNQIFHKKRFNKNAYKVWCDSPISFIYGLIALIKSIDGMDCPMNPTHLLNHICMVDKNGNKIYLGSEPCLDENDDEQKAHIENLKKTTKEYRFDNKKPETEPVDISSEPVKTYTAVPRIPKKPKTPAKIESNSVAKNPGYDYTKIVNGKLEYKISADGSTDILQGGYLSADEISRLATKGVIERKSAKTVIVLEKDNDTCWLHEIPKNRYTKKIPT